MWFSVRETFYREIQDTIRVSGTTVSVEAGENEMKIKFLKIMKINKLSWGCDVLEQYKFEFQNQIHFLLSPK